MLLISNTSSIFFALLSVRPLSGRKLCRFTPLIISYLEEFTVQKRGGKGVKCYKITEKTGDVVGVKAVNDDHEIMMITTEGIIIQLRMEDISTLGRITSGVKMINLDDNVKVAKIAKVREKLSDGNQEFENIEDAMEEIPEEEKYNIPEDIDDGKEVHLPTEDTDSE